MDSSSVMSIIGVIAFLAIVSAYFVLTDQVGRAAGRKGRNRNAWGAIAIFGGLIIPAIIVALMQPIDPAQGKLDPKTMKTCPYCAEDVKAQAVKCKHCGEELAPKDPVA